MKFAANALRSDEGARPTPMAPNNSLTSSRFDAPDVLAVIAVGESSAKLCISGAPLDGAPETLLREIRHIRLAENIARLGMISRDDEGRLHRALHWFQRLCAERRVTVRAAVTSAVLRARNHAEVLMHLEHATGLSLPILPDQGVAISFGRGREGSGEDIG